MKKSLLLLVLIAFSATFFVACEGDDDDDDATKTATLVHWGYDFSKGLNGEQDGCESDGEVIAWYPGGGSHPQYSEGLWWRNDQNGLKNEQKDMGTVNYSSINSAPAEWDSLINPLLVGHTYVVKCQDGYAAFTVKSVTSPSSKDWEAQVEYKYFK